MQWEGLYKGKKSLQEKGLNIGGKEHKLKNITMYYEHCLLGQT